MARPMGISLLAMVLMAAPMLAQAPAPLPPAQPLPSAAVSLPPADSSRSTLTPAKPLPRLIAADASTAKTNQSRVVLVQKMPDDAEKKPATDNKSPKQSSSLNYADRVFRFDDDATFMKRIVDELNAEDADRQKNNKTEKDIVNQNFRPPMTTPLVPEGTPYVAKTGSYPPLQRRIEAGYVVHRRLYFEELNSERYGWDLGFVQPIVSTAHFYHDCLLWPSRLASNMFERYDTSAGKLMPGSPVPYLLYPPQVDLFGATVGAATIVGTVGWFHP